MPAWARFRAVRPTVHVRSGYSTVAGRDEPGGQWSVKRARAGNRALVRVAVLQVQSSSNSLMHAREATRRADSGLTRGFDTVRSRK
jgi:hypothetical protein